MDLINMRQCMVMNDAKPGLVDGYSSCLFSLLFVFWGSRTHPFNGPLSGDYPSEPVPER